MVAGYRASRPRSKRSPPAAPALCPQRAIAVLTRDFPGSPSLRAGAVPSHSPWWTGGATFGQPSSLRLLRCPKVCAAEVVSRIRVGRTGDRPRLVHVGLDRETRPPPMMTADQPYDSVR
jgi:hypothetical protein